MAQQQQQQQQEEEDDRLKGNETKSSRRESLLEFADNLTDRLCDEAFDELKRRTEDNDNNDSEHHMKSSELNVVVVEDGKTIRDQSEQVGEF